MDALRLYDPDAMQRAPEEQTIAPRAWPAIYMIAGRGKHEKVKVLDDPDLSVRRSYQIADDRQVHTGNNGGSNRLWFRLQEPGVTWAAWLVNMKPEGQGVRPV